MAKLTSLADLGVLSGHANDDVPGGTQQRGYDGSVIRLKMYTEKRRGKAVTVVRGFQSSPKALKSLCARLSSALGTGCIVLDNEIELRGDMSVRLGKLLEDEGYKLTSASR